MAMHTPPLKRENLWRNDITGLRALAVLPVLLFHAFPEILPGGFFGVDVFFVISGYLISGIIFRELINGTFSFNVFYERRIRRIIPNLLLLFLFVSTFGYFFLLPEEYVNLGKHIYSSAIFIENFRLLKEVDYFTEDALRKPLLHLWSLSIEEQFYILFPIICVSIWRISRSSKFIAYTVILITLSSFLASLFVLDRNLNFYFPLTRFWELGTGICLAFLQAYEFFKPRYLSLSFRHFLSCAGIVSILAPMVFWTSDISHPGPITLLPVLGTLLIISATPEALFNRTLLSWRPITFIGLISYSLYLWHWPFLSFLFICIGHASDIWKVCALILSAFVSTIVYFLVEQPLRRTAKLGKFSISIYLFVGLILSIVFGQLLHKMDGFPHRKILPDEVASIRKINEWLPYAQALKMPYEGVQVSLTAPSNNLPAIVFAGDSHIAQYFSRAKALTDKSGKAAAFIACGGCAIFSLDIIGKHDMNRTASLAFYKILTDQNLKTLIIGGAWGRYYQHPKFLDSIYRLKRALRKRPDINVFILLDYPWTPNKPSGEQGDYDPLLHANRISFDMNDFIVHTLKMIPGKKAISSFHPSYQMWQLLSLLKSTFVPIVNAILSNGIKMTTIYNLYALKRKQYG